MRPDELQRRPSNVPPLADRHPHRFALNQRGCNRQRRGGERNDDRLRLDESEVAEQRCTLLTSGRKLVEVRQG